MRPALQQPTARVSVEPRSSVPASVERLRLACVALGLTLLMFSQSSGQPAADTKLDLVVAPGRFLRNALSMWDPTAAAGQLQDQAYGYLFPMGPFFLLGKLSALAPWVVQRSWESALLVAAFLGVVRLARLLGVEGFWPRVGAGLAYALAPRMLMEIGVISSELLPVVALPWVLIPLVRGATEGSPRRAAARSGVALLFASGINAAATLAILPVPALWLLTRQRGPRRRSLMSWWALAVVLACLWWVVPLAVLGRYSPPFLDWIESSTVTTSSTSLSAVLRGVDHWQAYLGPNIWPGGWILAAAPAAIVATTAVAALGLSGLARRVVPHRLFLLSAVCLGLVLVTLGHVSTVGPPFAGSMRHLLDGSLKAFRNVHKFDPVLRLPLAIGLGHALTALGRRVPNRGSIRLRGVRTTTYPRMFVAIAVVGVAAVAITPALAGRVVPQTRFVNDPAWWTQTGQWLGKHDGGGRALVVPGAAQPTYIWGAPRDDALQPVADGPWTVRDAAPLTQPGYIRLLDSVESILTAGRSDPMLEPLLARAGIRYLIVRNDLDTVSSQTTPLRFVHAAIDDSPGWTKVASFGPAFTASNDENRLIDLGLTQSRAAVEIYQDAAWSGGVASLLPAQGTVAANGSSDDLPQLLAAGMDTRTPVIFGTDSTGSSALAAAGVSTTRVLTDGIRKREFGFGGIDTYSATMTADQAYQNARAAHDYFPKESGSLSTVSYTGINDIRASSSGANVGLLHTSAADGPWAAVDGDPATAWRSASFTGAVGQWLEVALPAANSFSTLAVAFAADGASYPSRVEVSTDRGRLDQYVAPDSLTQQLAVPPGTTQSIRLTVLAVEGGGRGFGVAISTLDIPGVSPARTLDVPQPTNADVMAFQVASGNRAACLTISGTAACDSSWAASGEEDGGLDRTFTLAGDASYSIQAGVRMSPGPRLNALLDAGNPLRAIASTVESTDPRERAGAAVDGDLSTGWVSAAGDRSPTIEIGMSEARQVDAIAVLPIREAPVSAPGRVLIHAGAEVFSSSVPSNGLITFPRPVRARSVTVTVLASTLRVSTDSLTGQARQLPVGIGEIQLNGVSVPTAHATTGVELGCNSGPVLALDGRVEAMRLRATTSDILAGTILQIQQCGARALALNAGSHVLRLQTTDLVTPTSVTFTRIGFSMPDESGSAGEITVRHWSSTDRSVRVETTQPAIFVVHENVNDGWRATLNGHTLAPIIVDGWQQAWLVPGGLSGVISLSFLPQRAADNSFVIGALAIVLLVALAWRRPPTTDLPALGDAVLAGRLVLVGGAAAMAVLGGFGGLVVYGASLILYRMASRARLNVPYWLPAALLVGVGSTETLAPAGSAHPLAGSFGVQLGCLLTVGLLIACLRNPATPRPTEPPK